EGENTSASENLIRNGSGNEVQVVKVYPPSLQLEGIPILGRVVINDRGSVYLQDDTGIIKILPHFGFGRSKEMTENYPTFPSQRHIGHIYAWSSWCFLSEQIDVGSVIGKDERRRPTSMMLAPADSVFSLVYASVSDPHVLYEDHTFGGVSSSEKVLNIGRIDEKDLDECILILSLDETPALLEPDTAYVVCIHDSTLTGKIDGSRLMNGGRLASGTGSAICIKIGKHDHLHPVNITMSSPPRDAEQAVFGVPRLSDELFDLPYITAHTASDYVFNAVTMNSTVYSVRDIHSLTAQISDGSGIALVAVSDADALCELLQLPPQDLETVYQAAAQSSDGKLVWKQRSRQDGAIQLTGAQDLLGVAVTAVTRSTVLSIEGVLQSTETVTADEAVMRSIVKQTVRLGGRDCAVNRYTTATISALKMSRMTAAEWSWKLIESLAVI
ncbi:hypothetical protein H4217_004947, partial [Coemansia sp. RSA 1939]